MHVGAAQLGFTVDIMAHVLPLSGLENNILSRPYHVRDDDLCWWSHVGGFQKAERRTDDEVELVPLKKR